MTSRRLSSLLFLVVVCIAGTAQAQDPVARGRIAGRVVDASSGQAIAHAQVSVVDRTLGAETDLDGRYTITQVPVGTHAVLARRIGFQARRVDSVAVVVGQATVVNFTITPATTVLQSTVIEATRTDASASAASLLAIQQHAAAASDGISAEQIKRTPDSDAGAAAMRVSGISVVDSKFIVVRGLSERYSTTLVNGVDVASPEPAKKIVPLDIFPSSLLESIVVSKAATPDKPGDFSGGAVELKTKEFPDNAVRTFSLSQSVNSQTTFERLPFPTRTFWDFLGFDRGRRAPPTSVSDSSVADDFALERYGEGMRRDWAPRPRPTMPNLGFGLTLGGQRGTASVPLGYILSLTYSSGSEHGRDRFSQFYSDPSAPNRGFVYQDFKNNLDWGGVANFSLRLGNTSKVSLKNFYSRNAEELYSTSEGFSVDRNGDLRTYQFQYIERDLLQSQLAGEHLLDFLASSRIEWKATLSRSGRNEPDNRQLTYVRGPGLTQFAIGPNSDAWIRSLTDRSLAGQVDWSMPARLLWHDFNFKAGALSRRKERHFNALLASFNTKRSTEIPDDLVFLPPELLFTPENIGSYLVLGFPGATAQPYDADDDMTAWYGMVDTDILPRVRLVGGVRQENWSLDLFDGGRTRALADTAHGLTIRRDRDLLWSANITASLTDAMNLRLAAFASVARPDTRELSLDQYIDIVGSCATIGNPSLKRTKIMNADARWEWYPSPGEVFAISGFYKEFDKPIIRAVVGGNGCMYTYHNAESARNLGFEIDARKSLSFLPGPFANLTAAANYTHVTSRLTIDPAFGTYDPTLPLEGQSPYLVNASMSYLANSGVSGTVLFNVFGDRVVRYGFRAAGSTSTSQGPNIVEKSRATLDAKFQAPVGRGLTLSLSGKNLTAANTRFAQRVKAGEVSTGVNRPGVTVAVGVAYAR